MAVKDYYTFQGRTRRDDLHGGVELILFADEQIAYPGIIHYIFDLRRRRSGIQRHSHCPVGVYGKIHTEHFGHILREYPHSLPLFDAENSHGIGTYIDQ